MEQNRQLVITISRQLGSGGAYIGQQLAKKLNIDYVDSEILNKAAQKFSVLEADLDLQEEKIPSWWHSFLQFSAFASEVYMPPKIMEPTSEELFKVESDIIEHIAKERSAVIIGRCGFHILRTHPGCTRIFLHGSVGFRASRVQKMQKVSEQTATKMIAESDKARAAYINTFTGEQWGDAKQYDISIDTSKIGLDKSVELILNYLELLNRHSKTD